jgi:hypothetical protein
VFSSTVCPTSGVAFTTVPAGLSLSTRLDLGGEVDRLLRRHRGLLQLVHHRRHGDLPGPAHQV